MFNQNRSLDKKRERGESGVVIIMWIVAIGLLWLAGNAIISWMYNTKEDRREQSGVGKSKYTTTTFPEDRGPGDYIVEYNK